MRRIGTWKLVIDKFKKYLGEWKVKTMSFGCLMLIKSVLGSLPLYYFSLFWVPMNVLNTLGGHSKGMFLGRGGRE